MPHLRIIYVGLLYLLINTGCSDEEVITCDDRWRNGNEIGIDCGGDCERCYEVGDVGKYGGIVFYDKLNNEGGWRYLESYTSDIDPKAWGCLEQTFSFLKEGLGEGKENTELMAEFSCAVGDAFASRYVNDIVLNGYDGWYLPNKEELQLMYEHRALIGGFIENGTEPYYSYYWSSYASPSATVGSSVFDFNSGVPTANNRTGVYRIRPIAQF